MAALAMLVLGSAAWAQEPTHGSPGSARFEVVAVVLDGDTPPWAFLSEPLLTHGTLRRVTLGESVGPYRLVVVASDHIVMEGPDGAPLRVTFGLSGRAASVPAATVSKEVRRFADRAARARDESRPTDEDPAARAARINRLRERAAAADQTPLDADLENQIRERAGTLPPEAQARIDEWTRWRERRLREPDSGAAAPAQGDAAR